MVTPAQREREEKRQKRRELRKKKKQKAIERAKERKAEARGKVFKKEVVTQQILGEPQKKRIPTVETLGKRTPEDIQRELEKFPTAGAKFKELLKQGFTGEQAKQKFKTEATLRRSIQVVKQQKQKIFEEAKKRTKEQIKQELLKVPTAGKGFKELIKKGLTKEEAKIITKLEAPEKLRLQELKEEQRKASLEIQKKLQLKQPKKQEIKEELIRKVFKREPLKIPKSFEIRIQQTEKQKQQGIKLLNRLGLKETNINKFITKLDEQRIQKAEQEVRLREAKIDQSVNFFLKRANLGDTPENKQLIKNTIKTVGISASELDRLNSLQKFQDLSSDKTIEGLYRYGTAVFGLSLAQTTPFIKNRDVQGFSKLIQKEILKKESQILGEKGKTDFQRADNLAKFYKRSGIAKNITLNNIRYYVVTKDGKLKSAFEKVDRISVNNNIKSFSNVARQRNLKTVPVDNISSSMFTKISKLLFKGAELANRGANIAIVKRKINFDTRILSKGFVKDFGKFFLNVSTALPRAVKKGLFVKVDNETKRFAKIYKKLLISKGFDDKATQLARKVLLLSLQTKQRGLEDIREIDPNFNENTTIFLDPDVIETALLLVGAPLISKGIAKLGLGAKALERSTKPLVALVGRWAGRGIKAGQIGFVGTQVGKAIVKPDIQNIGNLLLIGGESVAKVGKSLIKKVSKTNITKISRLQAQVDKQAKKLKKKGIKPTQREFKEVQELNLLKRKLILQKKEKTLLDRLEKIRKNIFKKPTKNQKKQIETIQTNSRSIKTKLKKIDKTLEDFKKKPKKPKKKKKSTQKQIRDKVKKELKTSIKTGKKAKVKDLLLLAKEFDKPALLKAIKRDFRKAGFKFKFKTSPKTGRDLVDLKKIAKPKKIKKPVKIRAKEKIIERQLKREVPKKERIGIRRLKKEVELEKAKKQRASEKARREDVENAIKTALKKSISFKQEIILGVKKTSLSKKQIDNILEGVIEGQRKPKVIENTKNRFNKQIKQIQTRKAEIKKELNKMIGFSQIKIRGFAPLKKRAKRQIPKLKETLKKLDVELKKINNNRKEFLAQIRKNKLDVAKTSTQIEQLQFARRQKEFKEKAKKVKIKFERDFNIKPKKDEATMKIFLGKKLGTIEVFFRTPKTRGLRPVGKKAQIRPATIFKDPIIRFKHKSFNPKQIQLVKSKVVKQMRRDPRRRRADKFLLASRRLKRRADIISKPKKGVDFSPTTKTKIKRVNTVLDAIEERVKRIRLSAIGLAIANTIGFDTSTLPDVLNSQLTSIAKIFKDAQIQFSDLEKRIIKEIKQQKKAPPAPKGVPSPPPPLRKAPPPPKGVPSLPPPLRKAPPPPPPKRPPGKRKLPILTFDSKLPKGFRLSFDAVFRERKNPKLPQHPTRNPIRNKRIKLNLPQNRALKAVAQGVDRTNPRSFKLVISGITKKKDIIRPTALLKKYRLSKTKTALNTVEKSKFAIDKPGEKKGLSLTRYVQRQLKKTPTTIRKKRAKPVKKRTTRKVTKRKPKRTIKRKPQTTKRRVVKRKPTRTIKRKPKQVKKRPIRRKSKPKTARKTTKRTRTTRKQKRVPKKQSRNKKRSKRRQLRKKAR